MTPSEKRILGTVILLLGLTYLTLAYTNEEIEFIRELLGITFAPDIAGLP